ncbi:hypothetical protein [Geomonas subterranea]|uniref:hypothetical protein n=1 Tax=Geomonas subterranea TaxID=2847989 RepID=UPI001CD51081|nr:hypothetical protein [Geomonas fuzhouensis]
MTEKITRESARPSPLQNKVNPEGNIEAISSRESTLMGNRGVLHNAKWQVTKTMVKNNFAWIYCVLDHGDAAPREVMAPGRYTELFFLDEASALAAGHRPCNVKTCLRKRHEEFKRIWYVANERTYQGPSKYIGPIDERLHIERTGIKPNITYQEAQKLPTGTFVAAGNYYYLILDKQFLCWSHNRYISKAEIPEDTNLRVITPSSVVRCLQRGFTPQIHPSAELLLISRTVDR